MLSAPSTVLSPGINPPSPLIANERFQAGTARVLVAVDAPKVVEAMPVQPCLAALGSPEKDCQRYQHDDDQRR